MIQAKGIEKSFGTLKVLKGLDFSVAKSEVVSIMGASGAGKSTLLQILGTLSTPDGGSLIIDGIDVLKLDSRKMAQFRNLKLGFVFQFHHLLPEFTALENVMIPAFIAGRSRKEAEQHARELLTDLGLGERLTHKPSELSGGEQQRIAIARLFLKNPPIIFLDEPTASLDAIAPEQIKASIDAIKRDRTVVVISHSISQIIDSDIIYALRDGRVEQSGDPDGLYKKGGIYKDIVDASARSLNIEKLADTLDID